MIYKETEMRFSSCNSGRSAAKVELKMMIFKNVGEYFMIYKETKMRFSSCNSGRSMRDPREMVESAPSISLFLHHSRMCWRANIPSVAVDFYYNFSSLTLFTPLS